MIDLPYQEITRFAERYPIRKLSLFGSANSKNFTSLSDVDILVEFEPNQSITYLDMAVMQDELVHILGREVDLLTPNALSKYFRQQVLDEAVVIYEQH